LVLDLRCVAVEEESLLVEAFAAAAEAGPSPLPRSDDVGPTAVSAVDKIGTRWYHRS
jgi:hypothetical protein